MRILITFKNRNLEKAFIERYNQKSLSTIRIGFWLTIWLYAVFGFLDLHMMPVSYPAIWIIRFGIVIPIALISILLTYLRSLCNHMQGIVSFNSIIMGLGIISMIAVANESEPGFRYYYAGLLLVIMGICSLFRLRFFYSLFSSVVIILGYEFTAIFIQKISSIDSPNNQFLIFVSNNFFFISANVIGLMASYYLEYLMRVEFLQQEEIVDKHQNLNTLMNSMKVELRLAKHIQSQLFPGVCPYMKNVKIHSIYKPMEELGGDFYDYIRFVENNLIGIFISDVSGHGIPAALITSMLKTLNSMAGNNKFSPSAFLKYINLHIIGQIGDNFLTAAYILYDSETRIMKISRAGHPYPLLLRNREIIHLKSKGGIIGINQNIDFEERTIILEPEDKIILYTDGLIEEINPRRIQFEDYYFNEVLPSIMHKPIDEITMLSYQKLIEYKGDDRLSDDVCIVGLEIS